MIIGYRDTRWTHCTFSHFPVGRLLKIISRNGDEPFVYRVRACAHARRCAAPERIPVCASVHSGREISKSKIVQLVSSGVSAAYVANVRHQGTKRDEKRPACRSNRSIGERERERKKKREAERKRERDRPAAAAAAAAGAAVANEE